MDFDIKVIYSCPPAAAGETAAAKPSAEMAYAAAAEAEKKWEGYHWVSFVCL